MDLIAWTASIKKNMFFFPAISERDVWFYPR
jgi:hypothetical protein